MVGPHIKAQPLSAYVLWRVLPIAVAAMAAIGLTVLWTTQKVVEESVQERLRQASDQIAQLVDERLFTIVEQARVLAGNDLIVNGLIDAQSREDYLPIFFKSLRLGGATARISLVDYKGREILANKARGGPDIHRSPWNNMLSAGKEVRYLGTDGLIVAVPIIVYGLPEGAIVASFPPEVTHNMFDIKAVNLEISLHNSVGDTIYASLKSDTGQAVDIFSREDMVTTRSVLRFLRGGWISTGEKKSTAYAAIHQLRLFLFYVTLAALAAVVAASVISTYLAAGQLRRLSNAFSKINTREDFERRIDVSGPQEIRDLSGSFNDMLEALKQTTTSRSYLDTVLNSISEMLFTTMPGGEVITMNAAAKAFLESRGLDRNINMSEVIKADEYGTHQDPLNFLRVAGRNSSLEATYHQGHDVIKGVLWFKSPVRDDAIGVSDVYVGTDITERMHMEQMKTDFVSTVSHELRTPLTSIMGSVSLLNSGAVGELSDKASGLMGIAQRNCDRLIRLINDILDIQKMEAGQLEIYLANLDICEQVEHSVNANASYAEQFDTIFKVTQPQGPILVHVDADRLGQVFANLLSNAAKFSPSGGVVDIIVTRADGAVTIAVRDHGIGIAQEHQGDIFSKFKQVDESDSRQKGGTGLGLAISRELMLAMGGEIWLESESGEGSTFFIRLPEVAAA